LVGGDRSAGTGFYQPQSRTLWVLEVSIHVHTVVENSDYDDLGFRARSVKDDMAALAKFFVPRLYVFRIAAYVRLARKQLKGIIKLLKVFVPLPLSPLHSGKVANINNVFSGSGGEQKWAH
jgi:hypothetical protein